MKIATWSLFNRTDKIIIEVKIATLSSFNCTDTTIMLSGSCKIVVFICTHKIIILSRKKTALPFKRKKGNQETHLPAYKMKN